MQGAQAVEADHAIELVENAVEVAHDVIASVPHMAGVQAHAKELVVLDAVDDARELLEAPADLGALARHGLQKDRRADAGLEDLV